MISQSFEKFTKHQEEIRLESEKFKSSGKKAETAAEEKEESSDDENEQFYDARDTLSASVSGADFPCKLMLPGSVVVPPDAQPATQQPEPKVVTFQTQGKEIAHFL